MSGARAIGDLALNVLAAAGRAKTVYHELEALMRDNPDFRAWVEAARGVDIGTEAKARGLALRGAGEMVGPCPDCGGRDRFAINTRKQVFNCRGCGAGGDVIALTQLIDKSDFRAACEHLTGQPAPDGKAGTVDLAALERAQRDRAARQAQAAAEDNDFREKERRRAYDLWRAGRASHGTEAADYLAARGIAGLDGLPLRYQPSASYWHHRSPPGCKRPEPFVLHCGPALLAAITDEDGRFAGLHMTFFDPDRTGEKMRLEDPATGEGLPAKKIRGSKRRGAIRLVTPAGFDRLVIGEGIETVLSVACAEAGTDLAARTAYWASIDLGHLGGKAAATIAHPTLKTQTGRPTRVPGPVPDMDDPRALPVPDTVSEILTLGDGDSDRFTAEQVHLRAAARWRAPGRSILTAWAPDGADFNDVLRGVA